MATSNSKSQTPKVVAVDSQSSATESGVLAGSNGIGNALTNVSATPGVLSVSGIRAGGVSASGTIGVVGVALKGLYGSLTINANGTYTYVVDNTNATVNALAKGENLQESFTYTASNGLASAQAAIVIKVNGANDAATITGVASGAVIEDAASAVATGKLTVSDVDHGENVVNAINNRSGEYGKFSIASDGTWTYALNNNSDGVQSLAAGETATEKFVVTSKDGTASQTVVVTVTGTNDIATIHGDARATLTEDSHKTVARGEIEVHDRDHGESEVRPVANQAGTYGTFSVDAGGHWAYVVNNSLVATQALAQGEKGTDSFVVWSKDGSASQTVTMTVNGVNDQATITGQATGSVNEDANPNTATGKLIVNDVDNGENTVVPVTAKAGVYGSFSIAADGTWTYNLNNGLSVVQSLAAGATLTETFVVYSKDSLLTKVDRDDDEGGHDDGDRSEGNDDHDDDDHHEHNEYHGASKVVTVTIVGTNDAAVISGNSTGAVSEDLTLGTSGQLSVTDVDTGEASFLAQGATAGAYGSFSIDTTGQWAYNLNNGAASVQALTANETAAETFTVKAFDGTEKTVTITVTGTNDAASISGVSTGDVAEDTGLTTSGVLVVADVDHGEAVVQAQTDAAGTFGSFSIAADGTWNYALNNAASNVQALAKGEQVTDSFTVWSKDGTASQVVTVKLTGTNDAPVVTNTVAATNGAVAEDGATLATGHLAVNDVDNGATQAWSVQGDAAGTFGTIAVDAATGEWTYNLNNGAANVQALAAGEAHTETFTVRVTDDQGATADQQVSVVVNGTNDVATIGGTGTGTVTEDTTLTTSGALAVNDVDAGQAQFQAQANVAGAHGAFNIDATGQWTYTLDNAAADVQALNTGESLTDSFTVLSLDGSASQVVTVGINGLSDNFSPVAVDDVVTGSVTQVVTALTFDNNNVAQNYYYDYNSNNYISTVDTEGFRFATGTQNTQNGGSGPWITSWWGADYSNCVYSYGYGDGTTTPIAMTRADGGTFGLSSANITSYGDYYYYNYNYGASFSETVTGYLGGVQVAQESFYVPDANQGNRNNLVTLTNAGFHSVDKVVFSLISSNSYNYSYQWIDNLGVDSSVVASQTEDRTVDINVLANDTDPDAGDTLSVAGFAGVSAQGAAITLNSDGTLHYDPTHAAELQALAVGETLTDTFTYTAKDQHGAASNTATVSVVIHGANDAASISGTSTGAVAEDGTLQATGQVIVSDIDHGEAHVQAQSNVNGAYGTFSIATDGNWTYNLNNSASNVQALAASQTVSESFTVASADGTATQQISVSIGGANDAPVAANDVITGSRLTFEYGTYSQTYEYNYNTGNYNYTVSTDNFVFTGLPNINNSYGSGPNITGYWGVDYSYALYSNGYNYNYYYDYNNSTATTTPISMTKADGSTFALESANITGLSNSYNYGYAQGNEVETVTGYLNGVQVAQQSFTVPDANYGNHNNVVTFTDAGFGSVDTVVFSLSVDNTNNGYYYNYYYSNNAYQWIDNITTSNTVANARDVNVLANDSDMDNGAHLSVANFSGFSAHGAAISLNADGTLRYDPTASAELQAVSQGTNVYDTFTYQSQDEYGVLSNTATVSVTVVGVAHA
jgi:large repetitive protein